MSMKANELNKANELAKYFSSKFTNSEYEYGDDSIFINRYPLTNKGRRIKIYETSWGTGQISQYDKFYQVASIVNSRDCHWDSDFEISFTLLSSEGDTGKPLKFDYLDNFHFGQFWIRLKKHIKLLNEVPELHKKRELINFNSKSLSVTCFYRYDLISNLVSKCALLKFKGTKDYPAKKIVVLNNDNKFLAAMDDMEKSFQSRYYNGIVDRENIERGKFFNKKEQELIKMVYF